LPPNIISRYSERKEQNNERRYIYPICLHARSTNWKNTNKNAKQAMKLVNSIDSTEKLELLIGIEILTDNRNTVVDAAHNRLLKLEGYRICKY